MPFATTSSDAKNYQIPTGSHAQADADPTPENADDEPRKAPWRALFFFATRSNLPVLLIGIVTSIASGAMVPASAYVEGKLFDGFTSYAAGRLDGQALLQHEKKYICWLLAVCGGTWFFNFAELTTWIVFGELQAKSARDRLFHGLLQKELAWYDLRKNGIGALLPRIQAQIRELQLATSQPLGGLLGLISTSVLSLAQALYLSWDLTLVTIAGTPLIMAAVLWVGRSNQHNFKKQQLKLTEAQKICSSAFTSIETVKCFNGQQVEEEKYATKVKEAAQFYYRVANANALQAALIVLLSISMFVQGFYYGGVLIRQGKRSVADVLTTFLSAIDAFQALNGIIPALLFLEKGRIAGLTLRTVMAQMRRRSNDRNSNTSVLPAICKGAIDVTNISFAYPSLPDKLALDNVSLYIPPGDVIFLIGKSGSGKSTLGQLLLRFYRTCEGSIKVDGIDIEHINLSWLRSNITLVEQTSTLFRDTMFQNIAFGREDHENVSKAEVMGAVEFALLQTMITDMPSGLDTVVGYKGGSMSGGQRQRMALARARLRDTPIILLDESTSALDKVSRGLMMDAIRQWRQGKTTVVITHDVSQILPEDYAYILDHGKIVQEGYRKHMEVIKDSPFQGFLAPGDRASSAPFDARRGTKFESVRTKGSSLDSNDYRNSMISSDSMEQQLTASENLRASALFTMFQGGSPFGTRAAQFASPWLRMAVSPPQPTSREFQTQVYSPSHHEDASSIEMRTPRAAKRFSKVLEEFVEKTGQSAAESRLPVEGLKRHRRDFSVQHNPAASDLDGAEAQSRVHATIEGEVRDEGTRMVKQKSYKQILTTVWPSIDLRTRIVFFIGAWGATVHSVNPPVFSFVLSKLLQTYAAPGGSKQKQLIYSMIMLGLAVVDGAHTYLSHACMEYVAQRWVDRVRAEAIHRILDQPRAFFDKEENSVSRLGGNLDRNAEEMRNLIGRFSSMIWNIIIMCSVSMIWATATQWKMTLIALTAAPFIFLATKCYASVSEKWEGLSNTAAEDASSIFAETFTNIKTVRALTLEPHFTRKYIKATSYTLNVGFRRALFTGFFYGISDSTGNLAVAMVFYIGTRLVVSGASVNDVIQVFTMLIFTIANLTIILASIPQIGATKDTGSRLLRLAELPGDSHEHRGNARINTVGEIAFEDVEFAYPSKPEHLVLKNLNLRLQPHITTAVVGGSGSGKSTIANLMLNLYPVARDVNDRYSYGKLLLGGRHMDLVSTLSARSLISPVSQTPTIFAATVEENIAYGLPPGSPLATKASVETAARLAAIHDFISSLPQGYNTAMGDGGLSLSGGQAQRIAIARALIREPAVLLLDEATSSLDVKSATLIRDTIASLVRDCKQAMTVIIITHHRDMMEIADHVVVLDDGQVAEEGGFEELLEKNGALANLLSGGEWTETRQRETSKPRRSPFTSEIDWQKRRRKTMAARNR